MIFPILHAAKHHASAAVRSENPILARKSTPFALNSSTPQASKSRSKMAVLRHGSLLKNAHNLKSFDERAHPRMLKDTSARGERHAHMTCPSPVRRPCGKYIFPKCELAQSFANMSESPAISLCHLATPISCTFSAGNDENESVRVNSECISRCENLSSLLSPFFLRQGAVEKSKYCCERAQFPSKDIEHSQTEIYILQGEG